jgi:hypothetical protein
MAYVITDTCIKDLLCADVCPTDCIHPKKDEPASRRRPSSMSIPRAASTVELASQCAPRIRSLPDDLPDELKPFVDANAVYFAS